jgi:hypothetical protein
MILPNFRFFYRILGFDRLFKILFFPEKITDFTDFTEHSVFLTDFTEYSVFLPNIGF